MSEARRIVVWLEETLRRDDVPGKLRKLSVCHIVKGNKVGDEIRAVSVPDKPDDDWTQLTASKIVEQATTEATTLRSGLQRYVVHALFENDDRIHGRHVFAIDGAEDLEGRIDTDGPDADGLVGQSQKLTIFFAKEFSRSAMFRERELQEENKALRRECADLRSEAAKRYKLMEELASHKHERDIAMVKETGAQKRLDRSIESLELIVPMAVNHFAGRKLLPEHAPESLLLKQLAEKMTPEMFSQAAAVLGPELGATLFHLMSMVSKPAPDAEVAKKDGGAAAQNGASP